MSKSLYKVEYARTGSANCKVCKEKIDKGLVRFGILLQSTFYDGQQSHWHHEDCFFKKVLPKSIFEIEKFNILQYEDILRIHSKIKNLSIALTGPIEDTNMSILPTYSIEYSKSNNATCRHCERKIYISEIRVSKSNYDPRYGDRLMWYHIECIVEKKTDRLFLDNIEQIPGFITLNQEDQTMIKNNIKTIQNYPKEIASIDDAEEHLKLTEGESKLFDHYRNGLSVLTNNELKILADENLLEMPKSREERLDRLADCMACGVPKACPECKQGELVLDTFYYKCTGDTSAWSRCSYKTKTPQKSAIRIPFSLQNFSVFQNYPGSYLERHFYDKTTSETVQGSITDGIQNRCQPLKNIQFYLYGALKFSKVELKRRILKMGGVIVNHLTKSTAAIVANKEQVKCMSRIMDEAEREGIEVVDESYFDSIDMENGSITNSLQLIKERNIANWGSDPFQRIPQDVIDKSFTPMSQDTDSVRTKVIIKCGMDVDPDSGLGNISHVYKEQNEYYSIVLTKTNVESNQNSFYKLQLLEADNNETYWVFRSWGRTGTSIGGNKLDCFSLVDDALNQFKTIYMSKTKYRELSGHHFIKIPRAYVPIDINYDDVRISTITIDSSSNLPLTVQQLIVKIFDKEIIKNYLLQYELDVEKMPLGKLSKEQIKFGYHVLSGLLQDFDKGVISKDKIKDVSNKFYTIIPHNFGLTTPTLLDNEEIIRKKIEMLDSLLEVETIYKLLDSISDDILNPIESFYHKLNADIIPLDKLSPDYKLVTEYLKNTQCWIHSNYTIEIMEIFKVTRAGEEERFKKFKQLKNKRLLWHGSRITNIAGILSQGLRIAPPEAPSTGYLFGKGLYFADIISKSTNYCFVNKNYPTGFVLLCEVALGNSMICYKAENIANLKDNTHSVWGIGRTQPNPVENITLDSGVVVPLGKPIICGVPSNLFYNEYIVYDEAQVNIKYLIQLNFNFTLN